MRGRGSRNSFAKVSSAISRHPELVRRLFWSAAKKNWNEHGTYPADAALIFHFKVLWTLGSSDFEWLLTDACDLPKAEDRALATSAAFGASRAGGIIPGAVQRLREAVAGDPQAQERLEVHLSPPEPPVSVGQQEYYQREKKQAMKQEAVRRRSHAQLRRFLASIRDGSATSALTYLWRNGKDETRQHWSQVDYDSLGRVFDSELAKAARAGFIAFWRSNEPPDPDREDPSTVPYNAILGLAGLASEFEAGLHAAALSSVEAERAAAYAVWEMNGFPNWFAQLAQAHPASVEHVLAREIEAEFQFAPDREADVRITLRLAEAQPPVGEIGAKVVSERLRSGDPASKSVLDHALKLLSGTACAPDATLASGRTTAAVGTDFEWLWWAAWFDADADAALRCIERRAGLADEDGKRVLAEKLASFFPYLGDAPRIKLSGAEFIGRLYTLLSGGQADRVADEYLDDEASFSLPESTPRRARDTLLRWLMQGFDPAAYSVLKRLSVRASTVDEAKMLRRLGRDVARRDAQREPWSPRQLSAFESKKDLDPRTPDQLHQVAGMCLRQFKDEVERHDFSGTKAFAPNPDESDVQKHLALWLEQHARNRFDVDREGQVKDEKRTDIRLRRTGVAGVVTIEVKRAEACTLRQLRAAIEDQLIDLYMKPHTSRHGFLFIARMADNLRWFHDDGGAMGMSRALPPWKRRLPEFWVDG